MYKRLTLLAFVSVLLSSCQTSGIDGPHARFTEYTPYGDGPYPGVMVLPVLGGMNRYTEAFARRLSSEGYVTVAADIFTGPLEPVYDYLVKHPKVDPHNIGLVGFSWGGSYSLEMARFWQFTKVKRPVRAVVSYYHGSAVPTPRPEYPAVLFLHGDRDVIPWEKIVQFCEVQIREGNICEYKIYENTTHSFTHKSSEGTYNPDAERDAYRRAVEFLGKHLSSPLED